MERAMFLERIKIRKYIIIDLDKLSRCLPRNKRKKNKNNFRFLKKLKDFLLVRRAEKAS